jgi:hypothetical protein
LEKTSTSHTAHQLENLLRVMEDTILINGAIATISRAEDPQSHIERILFRKILDFRQYILNYNGGRPDGDYLLVPQSIRNARLNPFALLGVLAWSHCSRRVFELDEGLQQLLCTTSIEDVCWGDVLFPFGSFLVTLPIPLVKTAPNYRDEYDALLFVRLPIDWGIGDSAIIFPLSNTLGRSRLTLLEKQRMRQAVAKHDLSALLDIRKKALDDWRLPLVPFSFEKLEGNRKIRDSLANPTGGDENARHTDPRYWPEMTAAIRIVVGLCLYLDHLPPGESETIGWSGLPHRRQLADNRAVSNAANICKMASRYRVTPEEIAHFRNRAGMGLYELNAHWRKAHKRRPPGKGHDPSAEKTVKIPWVHVRKDRLKPGELPGGSIQVLK